MPAPTKDEVPADVPPAGPRIKPLFLVVAGVLAVALVGLLVAWRFGAFEPKMSHLPTKVGTYSLDSSTQTSSATVYDSATYRAGSGDVLKASIVKNAPDPKTAYDAATADTRYTSGTVYCTGVSKAGKGGTCAMMLSTGSAVKVEGSTLHTAKDIAQFTADLAASVR